MKWIFKHMIRRRRDSKTSVESLIELTESGFTFEESAQILNLTSKTLDRYLQNFEPYAWYCGNSRITLRLLWRRIQFQNSFSTHIISKGIYPLFLVGLSFLMTWFLTYYLSPMIRDHISALITSKDFNFLRPDFFWYIDVGTLLLVSILLAIFYALRDVWVPVLLHKKLRILRIGNHVRLHLSVSFCTAIVESLQEGLVLWDVISLIRTSHPSKHIRALAFSVDYEIQKGAVYHNALKRSMLDPMLARLLIQGIETQKIETCLRRFLSYANTLQIQGYRKTMSIFKLIAYVRIILVVVLYYMTIYQTLGVMEAIF